MFDRFGMITLTRFSKVGGIVDELLAGRFVASRCTRCGARSFPPRADCSECRSGEFEFVEISRRARLLSYTTIHAAPTGFEDQVPYTLGVVELEAGGRAMACYGETLPVDSELGTPVSVVPCVRGKGDGLRAYYTLERREEEADG